MSKRRMSLDQAVLKSLDQHTWRKVATVGESVRNISKNSSEPHLHSYPLLAISLVLGALVRRGMVLHREVGESEYLLAKKEQGLPTAA